MKSVRRPDNAIFKDLQMLTVKKTAENENALNYMITIDQEQDFYFRLKHQERPSGVY